MPAVDFDAQPVTVRWVVARGDDVSMPMQFATTVVNGVVTVPLDITGRTYVSSVARDYGTAAALTNPTVTVTSATDGELTISMTDSQTDALTESTYVFDLIENPATSSERCLIRGRISMIGRATP